MTDSMHALAAGLPDSDLAGRLAERPWSADGERHAARMPVAQPVDLSGLHQVVALIAQPAMLIDTEGRLLAGNRALARWLEGQRSMGLLNGHIRWRHAADQETFSGLLRWIENAGPGASPTRQRRLRIARQDKLLPLIVDCCRVGLAASDAMSSRVCHAVLVLHDPQASLSVNRALLMEFFGLSRAEAKVASLLAEGESPLDIGLILGVSTNTVRTHLRMIASKLGVSRQAEVVRMLMLLPAELD